MWNVCSLLTLIVWLWRYHWSNVAKKRRKLSNHKHEIWKSSKMNHLIIWTRPRNIYLKRNKTEWKGNIEKPMKRKDRKPFEKTYGRRNKTKSWIEGCGSECLMNWKRIRIQFTLEIIFFSAQFVYPLRRMPLFMCHKCGHSQIQIVFFLLNSLPNRSYYLTSFSLELINVIKIDRTVSPFPMCVCVSFLL